MVNVSLLAFARSGAFGPVELDLDRKGIRGLFGPPDDWSAPAQSHRDAAIWKYGTTEFHFAGEMLWLVHSDDFDVPKGGTRLRLDPWVVRRGLALLDFRGALTAEAVPYLLEPDPHEPGATVVRTDAGVRFLFAELDRPPSPGLSAFSLRAVDRVGQ